MTTTGIRTLSGASVRVIHCTRDPGPANALAGLLADRGATVRVNPFFRPTEAPDGTTHTIVVMPRTTDPALDPGARLAEAVGRLHRAVGQAGGSGSVLAFVQFGGGRFAPAPDAAAAAFARSVHLERPDLQVRVIDLSPAIPDDRAAALVLGELGGDAGFAASGFDESGTRQTPRVKRQSPTRYTPRPIAWTKDDVLLVTGGGKGITAECALAVARETGVKLALVGSSASDPELDRNLARYREAGIEHRYYPCDVTRPDAVNALIEQVRNELGPVTGVIHGAGANKPRRVEQVPAEEALREVSPKLLGAANLFAALADAPPKLFVALTSIIGVTGMPGNAWYGFSNESLDLALRRFGAEHPGTGILSVAFSVWAETGMGARMGSVHGLARMGIGAIPPAEGAGRFLKLFTHDPGHPQVVVTARLGGLDTWPVATPPEPAGLRFIDKVTRFHPDVELVTRTRLTLERDPYVGDHIFRGSALFPTVFGLEAMTQAAAHLTGTPNPSVCRIEDVRLERPIVVDPTAGVEIEIRAEALDELPTGERPVRVGIRTEQTGFAIDHFAATLVLGPVAAGPKVTVPTNPPLPIEPRKDLYGGLLFQGERFQKMGRLYELDGDHAVLESTAAPDAGGSAFGPVGGRLLLGDPFFRDVLLQTGQLTIPKETCLPIRIDRIERFAAGAGPRRFVFAPFKVKEGREYVAEIFATDEQGNVTERLTGYHLRILEEHPDRPSAEDMANPEPRDRAVIEAALDAAVQGDPARRPALAVAHLPGLHGQRKPVRHERELPVVGRALRARLGLGESDPCPFRVRWLPSGKPEFSGVPAEGLGLSITHDDTYCLCVVGAEPQGCDLVPVEQRTWDHWRALLFEARTPLLDALVAGGDPLDRAGSRIWAALEAARKATQAPDVELTVGERRGDAVTFTAAGGPEPVTIATFPVRLTFGPERVVAVTLAVPKPLAAKQTRPAVAGVNPDWHRVGVAADGPQGQPVQELRFVVSFQESSGISRRVPASRYLTWMGKMRELVTSANVPSLVPLIATGDWGLVTNWGDVRVCGEASANDVIQMRFWTDRPRGSEVEFFCDFWKVRPDGVRERVAFGSQKATWVRLVGHGKVVPEPLPPDLAAFIAGMGPTDDRPLELPRLPESLADLDRGPTVWSAPAGPTGARKLRADTISTSLEEANLVGNVYFANYFAWQNRARDGFLYGIDPAYFRGTGGLGEMVTLHTRVDYLREAMPFDTIQVVTSLKALHERGATLQFEYYHLLPDGTRLKLSVGRQEVAWVRRADGVPSPAPWPDDVRRAFLAEGLASPRPDSEAEPDRRFGALATA